MKTGNMKKPRMVGFATPSTLVTVHIPARVPTLWQPSKKKTKRNGVTKRRKK